MAFDMGFNFRNTSGFVTDNSHYGVPMLGEAYPHTYTNGDGQSVNAGMTVQNSASIENINNTYDPRIAGVQLYANIIASATTFRVDLSSGSAPGAGTYTIDFAFGYTSTQRQAFQVCDNATVLIDAWQSTGLTPPNSGDVLDATLAWIAVPTTSWTGATVQKTFATTTCNINIGLDNSGNYTAPRHFRLTLAGGGQSVVPVLMAQYRQRGA